MSASKTFERLSEHKRHAFLEAAFTEFASKGYEAASITHMVKELGIAKGSVYQYFDNKRDLYEHLLSTGYRTFEKLTKQACPIGSESSYKEWLLKYLLVQLRLQLSFPHYALMLQRIDVPGDLDIEGVHSEIRSRWQNLALHGAPQSYIENELVAKLIGTSSRFLFQYIILTDEIDLIGIIKSGEDLEIPGERLLKACASWIETIE